MVVVRRNAAARSEENIGLTGAAAQRREAASFCVKAEPAGTIRKRCWLVARAAL